MQEIIEKLLVIQDHDRKVHHHRTQLKRIGPERAALSGQLSQTQRSLETAKKTANQIESNRKELELEAEGKQELIQKYSSQQFQTKKNEEYQALTNEIHTCKKAISDLEDQQLELMEQLDQAQADIQKAKGQAEAAKKLADEKRKELERREKNLQQELDNLLQERRALAEKMAPDILSRYERLRRNKDENSIVGVDRGICDGCHVKLPVQIIITCKAQKEIVSCPYCGRIVYFAEGMQTETDG